MGGVFPDRDDFNIPSDLVKEYQYIMDSFIDDINIGHECKLIYPPKSSECNNCIFDIDTGRSSNIYKDGGPVPFANHTLCPVCGGEGRSVLSVEATIRLRVYYQPKDFLNIGIPSIKTKDGVIQAIGYLTDLPKLEMATEVIVDSDLESLKRIKCVREGTALPWGFGKRYFIQFLRIV